MGSKITINNRHIGDGQPAYIIAEMSANHNQDFEQAVKILHAIKESGADAVKLQTYTPETITIDSDQEYFQIGQGTIWAGRNLFDLYSEAYTPWEWQPKLKAIADGMGLDLFSSPFDHTAVDFLEKLNMPAYKIASFELVDLPLIERVAKTGKPVIMSTGMASLSEIEEAVHTARQAGASQIALLKCTSAYPAPPEEINLRTIPHLAETFKVPSGLSDHTLGMTVPVAAVALGASIVEKHFTLSREIAGPDSAFSLEPSEFKMMVEAIRNIEKALGTVNYEGTKQELASRSFRRSLFVVKDMSVGEIFTEDNLCSIRPAHGLPPKYFQEILGRRAARVLERGLPLAWDMVE
jgi:pseudaminic acid synthase